VRGDTPLSLKDYKIEGLSKLMGMLKMYDKIVVHLDLRFATGAATLDSAIRPFCTSRPGGFSSASVPTSSGPPTSKSRERGSCSNRDRPQHPNTVKRMGFGLPNFFGEPKFPT
jgi:hypothetical protein